MKASFLCEWEGKAERGMKRRPVAGVHTRAFGADRHVWSASRYVFSDWSKLEFCRRYFEYFI